MLTNSSILTVSHFTSDSKILYNVPYLICQLTVCQGLTINLHGFNWNVIQLAATLSGL